MSEWQPRQRRRYKKTGYTLRDMDGRRITWFAAADWVALTENTFRAHILRNIKPPFPPKADQS